MDDFAALGRADTHWASQLELVRPRDFARPSICSGWSVHDLINHVLGGAVRYRLLVTGASPAEVASTRGGDHVGLSAASSNTGSAKLLADAFGAAEALERSVPHRAGPRSGLQLLQMRCLELTLHGWDLARSLDFDDTIDDELAGYLVSIAPTVIDDLRDADFALYAPPTGVGEKTSTPQERLLRMAGREP